MPVACSRRNRRLLLIPVILGSLLLTQVHALLIVPKTPDEIAESAWANFHKGKNAIALSDARTALRMGVDTMQVVAVLAVTNAIANNRDEALRYITRADKTKTTKPYALVASAILNRKNQEISKAKKEILSALTLDPSNAQAYNILGLLFSDEKQYEKAATNFKNAIAKQPAFSTAHGNLGSALMIQGKSADAAASFVRTLELNSENAHARMGLGQIYQNLGMLQEAASQYEKAIEGDSSLTPAAINLAEIYVNDNRPEKGVEILLPITNSGNKLPDRVLKIMGDAYAKLDNFDKALHWYTKYNAVKKDAPSNQVLSLCHLAKGNQEEALKSIKRSRNIEPKSSSYLFLHGILEHSAGNTARAKALLDSSLATGKIDPLAHFALANLAAAGGDFAAAEKHLKLTGNALPGMQITNLNISKFLDIEYRNTAKDLNLAVIFILQSWGRRAYAVANTVSAKDPNNPLALYLMGKGLRLSKQYDQATQLFLKSIALEPHFVSALSELGKLYADREDYSKAKKVYIDLQNIPNIEKLLNPEPLHLAVATFYSKTGENEKALELYLTILKTNPKNAIALNEAGWIYGTAKNELTKAIDFLNKAALLMPANPVYVDNLGWMLYKKGDYKNAAIQLNKALQLMPFSPTLEYHVAAVHMQTGNKDAALTHIERALALSDTFAEREDALQLRDKLTNGGEIGKK